jgi:CDP-diacylglycerol---glycerol-3-phosphate 3-phosphatidyltransferase
MAVAPPLRRAQVWTLPNALSASRLFLAAGLFACIAYESWWGGLAFLAVAAVTDWLDGYLARLYQQTSSFGRVLDPLTDKVLVCGAFIFLQQVANSGIAPWMVTVIVARELLITGIRSFLENQGAVFGADQLGKLKMALQCAALVAILLALALPGVAWLGPAVTALIWAMLAATILSGVQYLWRAALLLREP